MSEHLQSHWHLSDIWGIPSESNGKSRSKRQTLAVKLKEEIEFISTCLEQGNTTLSNTANPLLRTSNWEQLANSILSIGITYTTLSINETPDKKQLPGNTYWISLKPVHYIWVNVGQDGPSKRPPSQRPLSPWWPDFN